MKTFIRAISYCKYYLKEFIVSFIFSSIAALLSTVPAYIVKNLVDEALIAKNMEYLNEIIIIFVTVIALQSGAIFLRIYFKDLVRQKIIYLIRNKLFRKVLDLSMDFFSNTRSGNIIARFNDDTLLMNDLINNGLELISIMIQIVTLVGYAFYLNWKFSLLFAITLPFLGITIRFISKYMRKLGRVIQDNLGDVTTIVQETIYGIKIVKSFTMEDQEFAKFDNENKKIYTSKMKLTRFNGFVNAFMNLMNIGGSAVIIWIGGKTVIEGGMTSGELMGILTALALVYQPMKSFSKMNNKIQAAIGAADRIFELLDTKLDVEDSKDAVVLKDQPLTVSFRQLNFHYPRIPDKKILHNIDLDVTDGKIIALVGHSGSGKSTMVDLIPRFYNAVEGGIFINDININQISKLSLREKIGIVPQESILFYGSIAENISYGLKKTPSMDEITAAAKAANAHDFIMEFPHQYETVIGEKGVTLSGGQKQRISIARALLKNPRILILDEATSALDTTSEKIVQEALDRLMQNRTTFVIAHRLSTIVKSDMIIVIENGRIVERGTHQDLISLNGHYKQLYDMQFKH